MSGDGYNYFLIIIAIVVTGLAVVANLYILVNFQHPEDRNQAWLPKLVVLTALTTAELSILMLPLDVGNRAACEKAISASACNFTMPMRELWFTVYMVMAILVVFVIPFTLFYYEADSDRSFCQRLRDAAMWVIATDIVVGAVIGIAYGLAGFMDYQVDEIVSGIIPLSDIPGPECISTQPEEAYKGFLCDAARGAPPQETWSVRTSFPVYVIALGSIAGWILFMVFAGVGVVSLPVDLIMAFVKRPRTIITKSEYLKRAKEICEQSQALQATAKQLHRQQQESGKTRAWKKSVAALSKDLLAVEDKEAELTECFPQSTDPDTAWTVTVIGYHVKLVCGLLGVVVSLCWVLHIILYMLVDPPATPFLNDLFVDLDSVFSLFGTAAFAGFCFYLLSCVIKGNMKLGLNLLVFTVRSDMTACPFYVCL